MLGQISRAGLSPVRRLSVYFPPCHAPSEGGPSRWVREKLLPMKARIGGLSQRKEKPGKDLMPETVRIEAKEIDAVEQLYRGIQEARRRRRKDLPDIEPRRDPLYRSLFMTRLKDAQ